MEQLLGVQRKVLHPHRHPLADGGELRRLEMRVGEAGQGPIVSRHLAHRDEDGADPPEQQLHRLAHQHQVGVVGDVGARGAQMNEGAGGRRLIAEMMDVRHHVMAQPALVLRGFLEIGVVQVRAKLIHCCIRDPDSQILLPLHERQPQPAPQADAAALAPECLHRGRGVACGERRDPAQTAAFARATSLLQSARN